MQIEKNKSLKNLNTFGFAQRAEYFCQPDTTEQLHEAIEFAHKQKFAIFILGAGSNIVLTQNICGLVIKLASAKTRYESKNDSTQIIADAGVNWHTLVLDSVNRNLCGLENLSLIPGNAGAAPIQNIGAYGVEIRDVLETLTAVNLNTKEIVTMSNADCQFGYRDSVFKNKLAGEYAIMDIRLKLRNSNRVNTQYQALADELRKRQITLPSSREVSDAVVSIRRSKLPDPAQLGNAGSFFKNPTISNEHLRTLLDRSPALPHHRVTATSNKIPAAWLVEQAGWKGRRLGDVGVHDQQALVLVNYGKGAGHDLLALASAIKASVKRDFGINLEQEPLTI